MILLHMQRSRLSVKLASFSIHSSWTIARYIHHANHAPCAWVLYTGPKSVRYILRAHAPMQVPLDSVITLSTRKYQRTFMKDPYLPNKRCARKPCRFLTNGIKNLAGLRIRMYLIIFKV